MVVAIRASMVGSVGVVIDGLEQGRAVSTLRMIGGKGGMLRGTVLCCCSRTHGDGLGMGGRSAAGSVLVETKTAHQLDRRVEIVHHGKGPR